VAYAGDPRHIGFNADYLLDFLAMEIGDDVEISTGRIELKEDGTPKSEGPWLLKPHDPVADKMDYRYVLMPMRI
jgi:DNA polymerase III sliding clamp (beta) subunit (PCNA family)